MLIENCTFDTGDDCIAIKSGRNADGRRIGVPSENIIIRGCQMKDGHGGVVLGSEMSGGIRNVFVEDCVMDSPNLDRAIRLKSNSSRGGYLENLFVRNVRVGQVKEAVVRINLQYDKDRGEHYPRVRNIHLAEHHVRKKRPAVLFRRPGEREDRERGDRELHVPERRNPACSNILTTCVSEIFDCSRAKAWTTSDERSLRHR